MQSDNINNVNTRESKAGHPQTKENHAFWETVTLKIHKMGKKRAQRDKVAVVYACRCGIESRNPYWNERNNSQKKLSFLHNNQIVTLPYL